MVSLRAGSYRVKCSTCRSSNPPGGQQRRISFPPQRVEKCLILVPSTCLSPEGDDSFLSGLVPDREVIALARVGEMEDQAPGLLLLPIELLPADQVLAALAIAGAAPSASPWMPVFVERAADGQPIMRPVSLGWPTPLAEVAGWAAGADGAEVLEVRHVLALLTRARHDLNNFLTAAMAETQLALMDELDPGLRGGLESVEEQLRRIRDLVSAMRAFRPPAE